jgi:hypothetical protein
MDALEVEVAVGARETVVVRTGDADGQRVGRALRGEEATPDGKVGSHAVL